MKRIRMISVMFLFSIFIGAGINIYVEAENIHTKVTIVKAPEIDNNIQKLIVDKNDDTAEFQSIQQAIDSAVEDSIIYVKSGTYNEIININKKIYLTGESKDSTIISPISNKNGYAIGITAEGIKLNGLSINNQGPGLYTTGIKIIATQTTIENCNIFNTPIGIAIWSSENTISNCEFWGCEDEGIAFIGTSESGSNNNVVTYSKFYRNCDGIELQYSSNNVISNSEFYDNTHAAIDAIGSSNNNNIISNCEIYNNGAFGIYLSRSSGNKIIECEISNNKIMTTGSTDNTITSSTLDEIYLIDDSSITIKNCENFKESNIRSVNSVYEIENEESRMVETNNDFSRNPIINRILSILSNWNNIRLFLRY